MPLCVQHSFFSGALILFSFCILVESYCALKSFLVSRLRINVCAHRSEVFLQLLGFHVFSIILVFFRWDILYILRWNLNDKHPPCWPEAEGTKWITALWFNSVVWHAAEYGEDTTNSREEEGGTTAVTECVWGGRGGGFGSLSSLTLVACHRTQAWIQLWVMSLWVKGWEPADCLKCETIIPNETRDGTEKWKWHTGILSRWLIIQPRCLPPPDYKKKINHTREEWK